MIEDQPRMDVALQQLANAGHQLDHQQRMTAGGEEVAVNAQSFNSEQLRHARSEQLFESVTGSGALFIARRDCQLLQRLAIDLAVGQPREAFDQMPMLRHHHAGQACVQLRPRGIQHFRRQALRCHDKCQQTLLGR